ncbi:MAG: amidase [Tatlockia sp.]|nr:amidase [Tatlockia sp.]
MQLNEYCRLDAHDLAKLIKEKQLSPEEVLDCALKRMHEVNPLLNAVVRDCSDWARAQLKLMTGSEPFYGVPILVKDLGFTLAGVPYTAGSRFFAETVPTLTSDLINRVLALGMLPFAQTNVPELGLSFVTESLLHGPCRNPYDLTRTAGGSSGGSAAAVAAGVAPLALASDGGGSIRIPAACCGLFGFKPSTGLISSGPWVAESWSGLATAYVLTRSVRDSAFLFDRLTAPSINNISFSEESYYEKQRPLKIAIVEDAFPPVALAKPYLDAVEEAVKVLEALGHRIVRPKLALNLEAIDEASMIIIAANTCAEIESHEAMLGRGVRKDELEPITWDIMMQGKSLLASQMINARNYLYQLLRPLHELFNKVDVILTPALAQLPLPIGSLPTDIDLDLYQQKNIEFSPFTSLFNQAGLPAMTMPVMRYGPLPISVQFAAAKNQDTLLLRLALQLQKEFENFSQPVMTLMNKNKVIE